MRTTNQVTYFVTALSTLLILAFTPIKTEDMHQQYLLKRPSITNEQGVLFFRDSIVFNELIKNIKSSSNEQLNDWEEDMHFISNHSLVEKSLARISDSLHSQEETFSLLQQDACLYEPLTADSILTLRVDDEALGRVANKNGFYVVANTLFQVAGDFIYFIEFSSRTELAANLDNIIRVNELGNNKKSLRFKEVLYNEFFSCSPLPADRVITVGKRRCTFIIEHKSLGGPKNYISFKTYASQKVGGVWVLAKSNHHIEVTKISLHNANFASNYDIVSQNWSAGNTYTFTKDSYLGGSQWNTSQYSVVVINARAKNDGTGAGNWAVISCQ